MLDLEACTVMIICIAVGFKCAVKSQLAHISLCPFNTHFLTVTGDTNYLAVIILSCLNSIYTLVGLLTFSRCIAHFGMIGKFSLPAASATGGR